MSEETFTDLDVIAQMAKNQAAMAEVIKSHDAEIARLKFRLQRLEERDAP